MILVDGVTSYGAELTRGLPSSHWAHMVSDTSEEELHAFAQRIGLKRAWAQLRPRASAAHYDLTPRRRALAVKLGAVEVSSRELVTRNFDGRRRRRVATAALPECQVMLDEPGTRDTRTAVQGNLILVLPELEEGSVP